MKNLKEILEEDEAHNEQRTKAVLETVKPEEEYIENGDIYCKKCHTRRTSEVFGRKVRCICQCQEAAMKQAEEDERKKDRLKRVERLKKASLLGERYKHTSFEQTDVQNAKFKAIYERCKKYTEVADQVLDRGIGIYLFGPSGVGKSHLTACMANKLMESYYTVLYTNFSEISKQIRRTFSRRGENDTEQAFIERLASIDFLFIDDFGTERLQKDEEDLWLQEKVFDVINKRYNNNKPTIFTSNYSPADMIKQRGLAPKTMDRIAEACETMELDGKSYRAAVKSKNKPIF